MTGSILHLKSQQETFPGGESRRMPQHTSPRAGHKNIKRFHGYRPFEGKMRGGLSLGSHQFRAADPGKIFSSV